MNLGFDIPRLARLPGEATSPAPAVESEANAELGLTKARAVHENVKIREREFNLAVKRGEYVERVAIQQAAATALAILAQPLRSLSDNLERECALSPEQCALVDKVVDEVLSALAANLAKMAPAQPNG